MAAVAVAITDTAAAVAAVIVAVVAVVVIIIFISSFSNVKFIYSENKDKRNTQHSIIQHIFKREKKMATVKKATTQSNHEIAEKKHVDSNCITIITMHISLIDDCSSVRSFAHSSSVRAY